MALTYEIRGIVSPEDCKTIHDNFAAAEIVARHYWPDTLPSLRVIIEDLPGSESDEGEYTAGLSWFMPFSVRRVTLDLPYALDPDRMGYTLLHELKHAEQGPWIIIFQQLKWFILCKSGELPYEVEAQDFGVNSWYDYKKGMK